MTKIYDDGDVCPVCKQSVYHTGEYPCSECQRPTLWDSEELPEYIER